MQECHKARLPQPAEAKPFAISLQHSPLCLQAAAAGLEPQTSAAAAVDAILTVIEGLKQQTEVRTPLYTLHYVFLMHPHLSIASALA